MVNHTQHLPRRAHITRANPTTLAAHLPSRAPTRHPTRTLNHLHPRTPPLTTTTKRITYLCAFVTGFALLVAFGLGWFESAEHARSRQAMSAAIHVPVIPPRFGLSRPSASDSITFQIFAKFPPENPATAYLAVEDSDELNERRSSTLKTRPADWLGKFGAVSLFDDGTVNFLPPERWRAVATDSVLVQTYITPGQSSAARIALHDRLRTNLALPLWVGGARTSDESLISVLLVDGRVTKNSGLTGGHSETARGECYVQVHRASDGRAVGPLFHLVGAADTGFNLSGAWLIDGQWLLWYEDDLQTVWAIRFDWAAESAALDAAPPPPQPSTPK